MERVVRGGIVRWQVRRRGLSALTLVGALPWVLMGGLTGLPGLYALGGLFLVAALVCLVPARVVAIDSTAGALRILRRSPLGKVERWSVPLAELRGVRATAERDKAGEIWIDLPEGRSFALGRSVHIAELRRTAERLAEDLGVPLNTRGL